MVVLGAIRSFLERLCGHLSPKIDKVSEKLTLRYPPEGPCVVTLIFPGPQFVSGSGLREGTGPRGVLALGAVIEVEQPHVGEGRKRGGVAPAVRSARPVPNPKNPTTPF
jgi:hypothetical protein